MKQLARFSELPSRTEFHLNGNTYVKRSTSTADLPAYGRWFRFRASELCVVGRHSRLADDYFARKV